MMTPVPQLPTPGPTGMRLVKGDATYVAMRVDDRLVGLPIDAVSDVFVPSAIAPAPLASEVVAGLINLRGRIVTAICLRRLFGAPDGVDPFRAVAVGVEHGGDAYGLIVDGVGHDLGDVLTFPRAALEPLPSHVDPAVAGLFTGMHRLPSSFLAVLDLDAVIRSTAPRDATLRPMTGA